MFIENARAQGYAMSFISEIIEDCSLIDAPHGWTEYTEIPQVCLAAPEPKEELPRLIARLRDAAGRPPLSTCACSQTYPEFLKCAQKLAEIIGDTRSLAPCYSREEPYLSFSQTANNALRFVLNQIYTGNSEEHALELIRGYVGLFETPEHVPGIGSSAANTDPWRTCRSEKNMFWFGQDDDPAHNQPEIPRGSWTCRTTVPDNQPGVFEHSREPNTTNYLPGNSEVSEVISTHIRSALREDRRRIIRRIFEVILDELL